MRETSTATMIQPKTKEVKEEAVAAGLPSVKPPEIRDNSEEKPLEERWDRIIRGLIYALTFFLPILFTPWTFEPTEFSKQMLLFILTTAALVAWLLKLLVLRNWRLVKTPLDVPIGFLVLIYLLASIFSIDRVASFLGFYQSFSGNFFQVVFLVIFYYLVVNNFQKLGELKRLFGVFFFSVFLSLLYIVLQFFGVFAVQLPFAKTESFNTIGGLLTISVFSALAVALALGFREQGKNGFGFLENAGRVWRALAVIFAFVVILTVNFVYAWVGLLVGLLVYMIFQVALSKTFAVKSLLKPLVLLIVSVSVLMIQLVFPFMSLRSYLSFNLPFEVRLDYTTARPVLLGVISEKPVLGSGPNTFPYSFSKYRDQSFNLSPFWNARFDKAPSEAAEMLTGTGILGLLAFEILSLIFIVYGFVFLFRKKDPETWNMGLAAFSGFMVLWSAHWFFFFNTVLVFSFWLLLAIVMALTRVVGGEKIKTMEFSFATSPRRMVSLVSGVSLALVLVIVFVFFASAVYASDIFFRKGLLGSGNPETFEAAQRNFEKAIRLNRFRPDYYLTYGEFLLRRINQELTQGNPNLGLIQQWLTLSINTSRAAVNLSPANWTAWERLANLYSFARPLVAGVDRFIIESLTRATENDPKNPILFVELGQVYRLAARRLDPAILGKGVDTDSDGLSDEQERSLGSDPEDPDTNGNNVLDGNEALSGLNPAGSGALSNEFLSAYIKTDPENLLKAAEAFRKAIALKEDYGAAYYQLALTLEQSQKLDEAVETMEQVIQRFPNDFGLKFELGRMYFNSGKNDQAARQFQEAVALDPNNANLRFFFGGKLRTVGKPAKGSERIPQSLGNQSGQRISQS